MAFWWREIDFHFFPPTNEMCVFSLLANCLFVQCREMPLKAENYYCCCGYLIQLMWSGQFLVVFSFANLFFFYHYAKKEKNYSTTLYIWWTRTHETLIECKIQVKFCFPLLSLSFCLPPLPSATLSEWVGVCAMGDDKHNDGSGGQSSGAQCLLLMPSN